MESSLFSEIWMEKMEEYIIFSTIRIENMDFLQRLNSLEKSLLEAFKGYERRVLGQNIILASFTVCCSHILLVSKVVSLVIQPN